MVKAGSFALGMEALMTDMAAKVMGKMAPKTDARAAVGISNRVGIGKV